MNLNAIGRLAGALVLTAGLAGCMDVTMEVEILSETAGKTTTTSVMGADFYAMAKAGMAQAEAGAATESSGFCEEEGSTLTENADGSATCVLVVEGDFAALAKDDDGVKFEVVSPGVVKVSFSTESMKGEMGAEEAQDEETKAMMQAFFEGHSVTIRIVGKEVVETNMTKSEDGVSAEIVIPFLDLLNGTTNLPTELFATVRTN